jgi:AraC family transcriptional regulator
LNPEIINLEKKILVGQNIQMSLTQNHTTKLWKEFMPLISLVNNRCTRSLYSVEVYPSSYFRSFNPDGPFTKWAAVEVSKKCTQENIFDTLVIDAGIYARFLYKGHSSHVFKYYQYIFEEWLPESEYYLDNRPHFAVMGDNYKNNNSDSEEFIHIPVKPKQ